MPDSARQNRANDRQHPRRIHLIAAGIFVLALALRLLHLWAMRSSPFFDHLVVDSVDFDARAVAILQGSWREEGAFYQAPLYPLFLAAVYKIFGHSLLAARLVQAVLGSLTAVLVYYAGRRLPGNGAGARVGVVAGVLAATYAMAIHFDGEILRPALVMFLAMLSLLLLLSASSRGNADQSASSKNRAGRWDAASVMIWAAAGLVLGLAAVARPTLLLFIPLAAVWVYVRGGRNSVLPKSVARNSAPRAAAALAVLLCALIPVAVVTAVNYSRSRNFVPVSYNGGINFYLGNNADYEQTIGIRPGIRWDLLYREAGVDPVTHPADWSRYYYGKAARYIQSDPSGYAALLAKKLVLFWNGHEIERNMAFSHAAGLSPLMKYPLVSFRWIAPLALVGLILAWRRRVGMGLPALLLLSQMAAVVAYFVCARYRMVVVPLLIVFASYAAVTLLGEMRRQCKKTIPYLALFMLALLFVNVDWYGISGKSYARDDYELALVVRRDGRTEEALRLLNSERVHRPDDPDIPFQLGITLLRLGRNSEAAEAFESSAALEPNYALSWFNLGVAHTRTGDAPAAAAAYLRALEVDPAYWEAAHAA
ncbi:MAG: tetratricopeptide repeat protein, partial [Candidatus Latescibacterota bacterium]